MEGGLQKITELTQDQDVIVFICHNPPLLCFYQQIQKKPQTHPFACGNHSQGEQVLAGNCEKGKFSFANMIQGTSLPT